MTRQILPLLVLSIVLIVGCTAKEKNKQQEKQSLTIAISKGKGHASYEAYIEWLSNIDSTLTIVDLYHLPSDSVDSVLTYCDGIVISGGPDISPNLYRFEGDTSKCGTIDYHRDSVELKALQYAMQRRLPLFGICRGLQLINVYQGGSLVIDLPTERAGNTVHRCKQSDTCYHPISNAHHSILFEICGVKEGFVNTNHHQGILQLGQNLRPEAYSPDSLIEAISWESTDAHPFMLAVQWHPERLSASNPYSLPLGRAFIQAVRDEKQKNNDK